jgi:HSP20 family protein
MRPADVTLTINDDVLTLRAERERERETHRSNYHLVERTVGVFQRTVRLPFPVDPSTVRAQMDHGVLTISIPKNDPKQRNQRIEVRSGEAGGAATNGSTVAATDGGTGASKDGGTAKEGSGSGESASHH